jgi:hypothetical protein
LGLLLCFPQKEKKERVLLWVLTSLMRVWDNFWYFPFSLSSIP